MTGYVTSVTALKPFGFFGLRCSVVLRGVGGAV